jgi:RNA polymerase-binding transcription factor DksA
LGESLFPGELWELLQAEKESVGNEIGANGPLRHEATCVTECEPWDEADEQMARRHRVQLEVRLRELNDAQDRLIDGGYGVCRGCRSRISAPRLVADPAAALCIACQRATELSQSTH